MEVQEAFVKIREQARAFLERPTELMAGLNILSTTNLDYFMVRACLTPGGPCLCPPPTWTALGRVPHQTSTRPGIFCSGG